MNTPARIRLRRGSKANLPETILPDEITHNYDEHELMIGDSNGNPIQITRNKQFDELSTKALLKNDDDITIYVSPNGNDNNDGLLETEPVTINKAIKLIGTCPTGIINVYLLEGNYGDVTINNVNPLNDKLAITTIGNVTNTNVIFESLKVENCANISFFGFAVNKTIIINNGNNIKFYSLTIGDNNSDTSLIGFNIFSSYIYVKNTIINNRNYAVLSKYGSRAYVRNVSGSNNTIGLGVDYCSMLYKYNCAISATTAEHVGGGIIW